MFVPGGSAKITYNPRESLKLEERVRDYLDERHKILSLSGPTKSGKTVLLKTVVPEAIWISGGSIGTVAEFWEALTDQLGGFTQVGEEQAEESGMARQREGGATGGIRA